MRHHAKNESAVLKEEVQVWLREVVIARDGGCIARNESWHHCNGYRKDGQLILQADHLITRSNSDTYADSRLVVCVCKGLHGWKSVGNNMRKKEYDELVKTILPPETVTLWEACERDSWRPVRKGAYDWKIAILALKAELKALAK